MSAPELDERDEHRVCASCNGTGWDDGADDVCFGCNGIGCEDCR